MPKLDESVTEGTIGKWLKQPGEKVNKYELLVEVQTDKVNTEIPSPGAGSSSATVRVLFNVVLVPIRVRVGLLIDGNGGASRSLGCESDAGGAKARRGERRRYLADRWHRTRGTGLEEGCGGLHRERTGCSGRSVASGTARGVVAGSFRWSRSDRGATGARDVAGRRRARAADANAPRDREQHGPGVGRAARSCGHGDRHDRAHEIPREGARRLSGA